jgi:hypothetical protein
MANLLIGVFRAMIDFQDNLHICEYNSFVQIH